MQERAEGGAGCGTPVSASCALGGGNAGKGTGECNGRRRGAHIFRRWAALLGKSPEQAAVNRGFVQGAGTGMWDNKTQGRRAEKQQRYVL